MAETLEVWKLYAYTESEWVGPLTLRDEGVVITAPYTVAVVPIGGVPTLLSFTAPFDLGGELGVKVGSATPWPLLRGRRYTIVARYVASPGQIPLVDMGVIIAR